MTWLDLLRLPLVGFIVNGEKEIWGTSILLAVVAYHPPCPTIFLQPSLIFLLSSFNHSPCPTILLQPSLTFLLSSFNHPPCPTIFLQPLLTFLLSSFNHPPTILKGVCHEIFDLHYFHDSNPSRLLINRLKYF